MKNRGEVLLRLPCRGFSSSLRPFAASLFHLLFLLLAFAPATRAAIPAPEKLLPDDTLVLVTVPDFARARQLCQQLPQTRLWNDPAMKPFREKFLARWNADFVQPMERELGVKLDDYTSLPQGQLTFAVTQNGWQGQPGQSLGLLLLLDTKDKSAQLKQHLADLRNKWTEAGKTLRTEKIRNIEFVVLSLSGNNLPRTLRELFPPRATQVHELGVDDQSQKTPQKDELVLGQVDSLLIVGNSIKTVEKVVIHLTGGTAPVLGELAAYQANHLALFRDAPFYGWINAKAFLDVWARQAAEKKDNPQAPNPFDPKPKTFIAASGLAGLNTVAFSFRQSNEGGLFQLFLGVPETGRQGLLKILAGEPRETTPPPFVPADAVKFQRWRMDGQKTWSTFAKTMAQTYPQILSALNFILDSANAHTRETDPEFDIRKSLFGNLGDDIISYEKAPRANSLADLQSPPSIYLLSSPNPQLLAAAIKSLLVILPQGDNITDREFLGRKIYSVPLPRSLLGIAGGAQPGPSFALHFAASAGYVALSTDAPILEEFLRTSEGTGKALRETPGLAQAAQKVIGPGTSLFGYENEVESMRASFQSLSKSSGPPTNSNPGAAPNAAAMFVPGALNVAGAHQSFKDWMDFSLLPPFDQISKYFYFTVYGGSASVQGLTFKLFAPLPPALHGAPGP